MKTIKNLLLILTFLILIQSAGAYTNPATINLGVASNFTVLSGTGITSVPPLNITGNIGTNLASADSDTAFAGITCGSINGTIYANQALTPMTCEVVNASYIGAALTASTTTAYNNGMGRTPNQTVTGLGGVTLGPGVYDSTGVTIATNVTLDSNGSTTGIFIFQISGTLASTNGNVVLVNGTQASNVFWLVSGTTAIGANTTFNGIVIGQQTVSTTTNSTINGRLFSATDVTFAGSNIVNSPGEGTPEPEPTTTPSGLPATLAAGKLNTCNSLVNYESVVMGIFGLALMVFGFAFVLFSLRAQNGAAILSGIMVMIVGFAMLLLGNYILNAIFSVLC